MDIFTKGNYKDTPENFLNDGLKALEKLNEFQNKYQSFDTDTAINEIRDAYIGNLLGFQLLNFNKHGFDAKHKTKDLFLEVKQSSISSKTLGGSWNDTTEMKALAFADDRVYTAVAVWGGAADLHFIVFGKNIKIGDYLLERVRRVANTSTRSTQSLSISKLIKDFGFQVIIPSNQTNETVISMIRNYQKSLVGFLNDSNLIQIKDLKI